MRYDAEDAGSNMPWRIGALLTFFAFVWIQNCATKARLDDIEASVGRLEVAVSEFRRELRGEMAIPDP